MKIFGKKIYLMMTVSTLNNLPITKSKFITLSAVFTLLLVFVTYKSSAQNTDFSLLKQAISLRQSHQNQQAVDILEGLKIVHQDHKRINIELVINYMKLDQYDKANPVIAHLYTLKLSDNELAKLKALQKRLTKLKNKPTTQLHPFGLSATIFTGVDSISSQFPIYEYIGDIDWQDGYEVDNSEEDILLTRSELTEKQSNQYTAQQVKGFYRYTPKQQISLFNKKNIFVWSNKLSLYRQKIQNKNNYQQVKFDSNISLISTARWLFDLRFRIRSHFYGDEKTLDDTGIQFLIAIPINHNRLKLGLERRNKNFNKLNSANNSTITTPWLEYAFSISANFSTNVGIQYRNKHADDPFNSYGNINLYTRFNYNPTEKMSTYILLNYNKLHYDKDDPEEVNWSEEIRKSIALGVNYQFNHNFNIGLNSHLINNKVDNDNGQDEWFRVEAFISYQF